MVTLPPGWTSAQDPSGRTYYLNHNTEKTTWKMPAMVPPAQSVPVAAECPTPSSPRASWPSPPPPAAGGDAILPGMPPTWTPARVVFWIFAGLGWLTWSLAVSATGGSEWFMFFPWFHVGQSCNDSSEICTQFTAFKVFQILAVLTISGSMVLITLSFFVPHARVLPLDHIGARGLIGYAMFQLLAIIMVVVIRESTRRVYFFVPPFGGSFGAAVTAFIFGLAGGVCLRVLISEAGHGPIYECTDRAEREPGHQTSTEGSGAGIEQ